MKKIAKYWEENENQLVTCNLCFHHCKIKPGQRGLCNVRGNEQGKLYNMEFGETISISIDPIEKKPLFHFHPDSVITSIGPNGCNLDCPFCQNSEISQQKSPTYFLSPEQAGELSTNNNSIGLAYTYTEPLIWFEYLLEAGEKVRERGGYNVLVSNGTINPEPLKELLPLIDAANIDLKSFTSKTYKQILKGDLDSVLNTIATLVENKIHVEVTTLIVTGLNDSESEIEEIVNFLANLNPEIPYHLSRYFPHYKYQQRPTDTNLILSYYKLAKKKLPHTFIGNFLHSDKENSYCPNCNHLWIKRSGFHSKVVGIENGLCLNCKREVGFPI